VSLICHRPTGSSEAVRRYLVFPAGDSMSVEDDIMARIKAAQVWDKDSKIEDFQLKAGANGFVLINLKTSRAQLIYDEHSRLDDWKQLFPNVIELPSRARR